MTLVRYRPWNMLNEMQQLLDRGSQGTDIGDGSSVETSHWVPAVDIKEEPKQFIIKADLPGVDKNNIEISMENNVLTIKGERQDIKKEERENYSRVERTTGSFYRRFTLPNTADSEKIQAKSKHGVLEVTIPKKEVAVSRRIEIH